MTTLSIDVKSLAGGGFAIRGYTAPYRQQLQEAGATWDTALGCWIVRDKWLPVAIKDILRELKMDAPLTVRERGRALKARLDGQPPEALFPYLLVAFLRGFNWREPRVYTAPAEARPDSEPVMARLLEVLTPRPNTPAIPLQSGPTVPALFQVGDPVLVEGSPIVGKVVALGKPQRYEGKVCVTRPNPKKPGVNMTHWIRAARVRPAFVENRPDLPGSLPSNNGSGTPSVLDSAGGAENDGKCPSDAATVCGCAESPIQPGVWVKCPLLHVEGQVESIERGLIHVRGCYGTSSHVPLDKAAQLEIVPPPGI